MSLSDGRFLMGAERFDALLASGHTADSLEAKGLVRVHEAFRVIAIGLPVPAFAGFPLDPPLRSRFQGLFVGVPPIETQLAAVEAAIGSGARDGIGDVAAATGIDGDALAPRLVGMAEAVRAAARPEGEEGQAEGRLLHLGHDALLRMARTIELFPTYKQPSSLPKLLARAYPHALMGLTPQEEIALAAALTHAAIPTSADTSLLANVGTVQSRGGVALLRDEARDRMSWHEHALGNALVGSTRVRLAVGVNAVGASDSYGVVTAAEGSERWVETEGNAATLRQLVEDHATGADLCIVGRAGGGKSALAKQLAATLGYNVTSVPLYRDMSAQDLLQRRHLDAKGNTSWLFSPVVEAALNGDMCILDGIHRLRPDGLASLQQLLSDRETALLDGTRLLRAAHFDAVQRQMGCTAAAMREEHRLLRVHHAFRVVALAQPPTNSERWLSSELLPLFAWHSVASLTEDSAATRSWIKAECPSLRPASIDALLSVAGSADAVAPFCSLCPHTP